MNTKENKILNSISGTLYAEHYGLNELSELKEFPIVTYDDISSFVLAQYNTDVPGICREEVIYWALTSGTSAKPKLVPITKEFLDEYVESTRSLFEKLESERGANIFGGKILPLIGKHQVKLSPTGISVGCISGLIINRFKNNFGKLFVYDISTADSKSWLDRWDYIKNSSMSEDITCIFAINPLYIIHILQYGLQHMGISELNSDTARVLWPRLDTVICQSGGTCSHYFEKLRKLFPNVLFWDGGIAASEGYFAKPSYQPRPIGYPNSKYYTLEFLEESKNSSYVKPIRFHELEDGKVYQLVSSACNGFIRYNTKDLVQKRNDKLLYRGRSNKVWSYFGERLTENQVLYAVKLAMKDLKWDFNYLVLANVEEERYILAFYDSGASKNKLEGKDRRLSSILNKVASVFDKALCNANVNYKYCRFMYRSMKKPIAVCMSYDRTMSLLRDRNEQWGGILHAQEKPELLVEV